MNEPNPQPLRVMTLEQVLRQRFVTARMAARSLAIPLHNLNVAALREQKGVPAYEINGLLRFQIDELKQWQQSMHDHANQPLQEASHA